MAAKKKARPTELAARRKQVMAEIAALEVEKAKIDAQLQELNKDESYEGDGVVLNFIPIRNLDTDFIQKKLPFSKRPDIYKHVLDTAKFKAAFSDKLATYQTISYRISVKEIS